MNNRVVVVASVVIFLLGVCFVSAQNNADDKKTSIKAWAEFTLEELMDIPVTVSTKMKQSQREAPNIVTVITAEDIRNNHCRDLVDVFAMVPGLNVAKDLNEASLISRGLYGFEGRALILIDGMQLTDLYFGSYTFGNDIPVHLIDRIEIIRGPGSVIYGGAAELSVINIITSSGEQVHGIEASARYGQLPSAFGHADVGIKAGEKTKVIEYSLLASFGRAERSDGLYPRFGFRPDIQHDYSTAGAGATDVIFKATVLKNTEVKAYFHSYFNNFLDNFSVSNQLPAERQKQLTDSLKSVKTNTSRFLVYGGEIVHKIVVGESLTITPALNYQYSESFTKDKRENPAISRIKPSALAEWREGSFEYSFGGEAFWDHGSILKPDNPKDNEGNGYRKVRTDPISETVTIYNYALYGSIVYRSAPFYLTAGARYDNNELFGNAINPRIGATYVTDKFHAKLLYSSAFRAPLMANNAWSKFGLDPTKPWRTDVKPEKTEVVELELGYKLIDNLYASANVFYQKVQNIIEFRYNVKDDDLFSNNGGTIATYGLETEVKYVTPLYRGMFNLSLVAPQLFDDPANVFVHNAKGGDTYLALHAHDELMGVPNLKIYTSHSFVVTPDISLNANMLYLSPKNAMTDFGKTATLPAQILVGGGIIIDNVANNLNIGISVHDLFNQRLNLVTPFYDSGYDTYFWKGREISIALRYTF